jgi:diadenosine tetraphosphate (Ap4A) HIT family hydrolase
MTAEPKAPACELCFADGGSLVVRNELLRVVLVDDPDYPGYARVIVNAHVKEMTDLDAPALARVMAAVYAVEDALRAVLAPDKINLASFGNVVPHLHWHVIPRFVDDAHFPQPIWGVRQREPAAEKLAARRARLAQLAEAIRVRLAAAA